MKKEYFITMFGIVVFLAECRQSNEQVYDDPRADAAIAKLMTNDVPLPRPQHGDWLEDHAEAGQSFEQYKLKAGIAYYDKRNKIYVLPLGRFTAQQSGTIRSMA